MELTETVTEVIVAFVATLPKIYLDEKGNSPITRFLLHDRPDRAFLPTRRVWFFLLLGLAISACALYLTEDQYLKGPAGVDVAADVPGPNRVTNASDFPVHIAFHNVGCHVASRPDPVLAGVTGEVRPGRLTAILGGSGSGKTTLANMILGRTRTFCEQQFGAVYMNGRRRSLEIILDRVGFVPQDDVLYPELTVQETLQLSADSRLPRFASEEYKARVIQETLEMLGLLHLRDRQIRRSSTGGLSGGEIKRVSIGMELVTHPSVLIMDEPTSGLDSAAALHIVQTLRMISDRGVAVVAVLHQPTTKIYGLINDLVLLRNGKPMYVGSREQMLPYFKSLGFRIPDFARRSSAPGGANGAGGSASTEGIEADVDAEDGAEGFLDLSPPEFIMDVLAGTEEPEPNSIAFDSLDAGAAWDPDHLHALWLTHGRPEDLWKEIEVGMDALRRQERQAVRRLFQTHSDATSGASALGLSGDQRNAMPNKQVSLLEEPGLETCDENYPSVFRFLCYILWGLSQNPSYPVRPKPGLFQQFHMWFLTHSRIFLRRGVLFEACVVVVLGMTVAFTRSYNMTWNRRMLGGYFTSIAISLVGMLGALFSDDVGPVRRAADSGMMLGAYQFSLTSFTIVKSVVVAILFATSYFSVMYLRRGVWCCSPFSWLTFWEYCHMVHLLYMCSYSIGSVVCVIAEHDLYHSYVLCMAVFIYVHTFAFFAPNKTQVKEDALILGTLDTKRLIDFLCSLSYVRYFMEANMLWEPVDDDVVGRNNALRFFGYERDHKAMCFTCMFAIYAFNQAMRFMAFTRMNRNVFTALHQTPLLLIFCAKVATAFVVSLLIMTALHEIPRLRKAFESAMEGRLARQRSSQDAMPPVVDDQSEDQ